mgnify:CR=1 FL=1
MKIDLHNHTDLSDGLLSPEALVLRKIELGMDLIAITDHFEDIKNIALYFDAIDEISTKYKDKIIVIAGVEIEIIGQHVVVFGKDYINELHETGKKRFNEFPKRSNNCSFILAHPKLDDLSETLIKRVNAIEITSLGRIIEDFTLINSLAESHGLLKLAASDFHSIDAGNDSYTEFEEVSIKSEKDLIDFLLKGWKNKVIKYYLADVFKVDGNLD